VAVQAAEALSTVVVVVQGKRAGMRIERECAERSAEAQHLQVELLGMTALGGIEMLQWRSTRVHRVQKPEIGDLASGKRRLRRAILLGKRQRRAFLLQNLNQPPKHGHEALAGADPDAGRNELRIEDEVAGS